MREGEFDAFLEAPFAAYAAGSASVSPLRSDLNPFLARIRSRIGLTTPWHVLRHRFTNHRAVPIFAA